MIFFNPFTHTGENTKEELTTFYEMLGVTEDTFKEQAKKDPHLKQIIKLLKMNYKIEKLEEGRESGHTLRVAHISKKMATSLSLEKNTVKNIYFAALFHDIGKYLIPSKIIGKKGPLTDKEYEIVKTHVTLADNLLEGIFDEEVLEIIRCHHERMDKSGYPRGIVPPNIGSKIIGLVDSYDAMTSNRVYSTQKSQEIAFQELIRCTIPREEGGFGYLYDPELVKLLIKLES